MNDSTSYSLKEAEAIFDHFPVAVGIYDTEKDQPVYFNDAYYQLTGYSKEEYTEKIFGNELSMLYSEDILSVKNKTKELTDAVNSFQFRAVCANDRIRWITVLLNKITLDNHLYRLCFYEDKTPENETTDHLKLIIESIGSSVSILKITQNRTELIYGNDRFFQALGISREVFEKDPFDLPPYASKHDQSRVLDAISQSLSSHQPQEVEHQLLVEGKEPRYVSRRLYAVRQNENDSFLLFSIATDITGLKKKEEEQERIQNSYETALNSIPNGLIKLLITEDHDLKVLIVNQSILSMVGLSQEQFMSHYRDHVFDAIHPDDVAQLKYLLSHIGPAVNMTLEFRLYKEDGSWIWIKSTSSLCEEDGQQVIYSTLEDISEEHERSLMMDSLLNNLPGGAAIFKITDQIECLYFNEGFAALSGRTFVELQKFLDNGGHLENFIHSMDRQQLMKDLQTSVKERHPFEVTYRYLLKDGSIGWLHANANIIREEDGYPVYYCVFSSPIKDISQYKNIIEYSPTGMAVLEHDTRKVMEINTKLREICDLPDYAEVIGRCVTDILPASVLLTEEEIKNLSFVTFKEYTREFPHHRFCSIKTKAFDWNGINSYIIYVSDKTVEHERDLQREELLNLVPSGIGIYHIKDSVTKLVYINDSFYSILKTTREEYEKKKETALLLVHPDDRALDLQKIQELEVGKDNVSLELRALGGDGLYHWLHLSASVIKREESGLTVYCSFSDYEQTMKAQNALRQRYLHEQERRRSLEKSSDISFRFNLTKNALEDYRASQEYEQYSSEMDTNDINNDIRSRVPVSEQDKTMTFFNRSYHLDAYQKGITEVKFDYRSKQKDGRIKWFRVISNIEKDESTQDIISHAFVRNITDEKKTELAYASVVDEETDFVVIVNSSTGIGTLVRKKNDKILTQYNEKSAFVFSEFLTNKGVCTNFCVRW